MPLTVVIIELMQYRWSLIIINFTNSIILINFLDFQIIEIALFNFHKFHFKCIFIIHLISVTILIYFQYYSIFWIFEGFIMLHIFQGFR